VFIVLALISLGVLQVAAFQEGGATSEQELVGTVEAFEGSVMIVDGQIIDVSMATIGEGVAVGEMVIVHATVTESGIWIANSVDVHVEEPVITITLDGPIEAIAGNIVTIGGFDVVIDPDDPVLALLEVGMSIVIEAVVEDTDSGMVISAVTVIIDDVDHDMDDDDMGDETPEPEETPEVTPQPDDDGDVIIIIEGPVEEVNINIITIFNFNIEVDPSDPLLTVIRIGDVLRVEGNLADEIDFDGNIVLIAINITFINVEVFVLDDQVWRDPGDCSNAPPPWAPANGWRRRCDSSGDSGSGGRHDDSGSRGGRGRGGSGSRS